MGVWAPGGAVAAEGMRTWRAVVAQVACAGAGLGLLACVQLGVCTAGGRSAPSGRGMPHALRGSHGGWQITQCSGGCPPHAHH